MGIGVFKASNHPNDCPGEKMFAEVVKVRRGRNYFAPLAVVNFF